MRKPYPFYTVLLFLLCLPVCNQNSRPDSNPDSPREKPVSADSCTPEENRIYRILYISSYHIPWEWPEEQLEGFKSAFSGIACEYKSYYMDTKRKSTREEMENAGKEAIELIHEWEPDLVYITDDNAQEYVTRHFVNSSIPFVFSGVNAEPEDYNFTGSRNIAGILEREHSVETINLLREMVPDIQKIAIISDSDITWPPVFERIKKRMEKELPEIEIIARDILDTFQEYKEKIMEYKTNADAVIHLGDFAYKDQNGNNVPFEILEKWTVKNSLLPDVSFWEDRVRNGYLAAVTISGLEQGREAGLMARTILVDNQIPGDIGFQTASKGKVAVNLARARALGIQINSSLLLSARVFDCYEWEEAAE